SRSGTTKNITRGKEQGLTPKLLNQARTPNPKPPPPYSGHSNLTSKLLSRVQLRTWVKGRDSHPTRSETAPHPSCRYPTEKEHRGHAPLDSADYITNRRPCRLAPQTSLPASAASVVMPLGCVAACGNTDTTTAPRFWVAAPMTRAACCSSPRPPSRTTCTTCPPTHRGNHRLWRRSRTRGWTAVASSPRSA